MLVIKQNFLCHEHLHHIPLFVIRMKKKRYLNVKALREKTRQDTSLMFTHQTLKKCSKNGTYPAKIKIPICN